MAITNERICICGQAFVGKVFWQTNCTRKCYWTYKNALVRATSKKQPRLYTNCMRCNSDLSHKRADAMYCSKTCKSMDHTFKHRSETRSVTTARRYKIYLRDNRECYICKTMLDFKDVEIDHIIPVHLGGLSDSSNLAVSCLSCNRKKGISVGRVQHLKLLELADDY